MSPRCHVERRISQVARDGGMNRKPFPTQISLVDEFRGVFARCHIARVLREVPTEPSSRER